MRDRPTSLIEADTAGVARPTYGSLFSGVGGMDLGFDDSFDCVFQVEWDERAQSILRRHWRDVPRWDDVCDVDGAHLPPCDAVGAMVGGHREHGSTRTRWAPLGSFDAL